MVLLNGFGGALPTENDSLLKDKHKKCVPELDLNLAKIV